MRIVWLLLAGLLVLVMTVPAKAQPLGCKTTLTSLAKSKYLRNLDIPTNEPVIQTDLYVTCDDGWGFDLWKSVSLSRGLNSNAAEVDYTVFKTGNIPSLGVNYDVGISYYDLNRVFKFQSGDLLVPYLELGMTNGFTWTGGPKIVPFTRVEVYHGIGGKFAHAAPVFFLGADHFWKLDDAVLLSNRTAILRSPNALGVRPGFSFVNESKLKWAINKSLTVILPEVKFAAPVHISKKDNRRPNVAIVGGISISF